MTLTQSHEDKIGQKLVGDEVGACAAGNVVLGCGDEELAGRVQLVGIPSRFQHSLSEDQVDVSLLADADAYPQVHLRANRALSHDSLGWPLGRGYKGNGQRTAEARDRVGVAHRVGRFLGQFGVLINDDDERGHFRGWFPYSSAGKGKIFRAALKDRDHVSQQCGEACTTMVDHASRQSTP